VTDEYCACARVVWKERHSKIDGATFGWWGCDLCGREFVTKASRDRIGHDFEERLAEYKREVERRNELLAGADADLMTEREKVARLEESRELAMRLVNETIARILDGKARLEAEVSALKAENEHLAAALRMETERVAVAVEAEREACAKVAERRSAQWTERADAAPTKEACERAAAAADEGRHIAAALRGRRP